MRIKLSRAANVIVPAVLFTSVISCSKDNADTIPVKNEQTIPQEKDKVTITEGTAVVPVAMVGHWYGTKINIITSLGTITEETMKKNGEDVDALRDELVFIVNADRCTGTLKATWIKKEGDEDIEPQTFPVEFNNKVDEEGQIVEGVYIATIDFSSTNKKEFVPDGKEEYSLVEIHEQTATEDVCAYFQKYSCGKKSTLTKVWYGVKH